MIGSNHPGLALPKPRARLLSREEKEAEKRAHWRRVKFQVMRRDRFICRCCGKRATTNGDPHHILYRSHGGKDEPENLVWLCRRCHDAVHAKLITVSYQEPDRAGTIQFRREVA